MGVATTPTKKYAAEMINYKAALEIYNTIHNSAVT